MNQEENLNTEETLNENATNETSESTVNAEVEAQAETEEKDYEVLYNETKDKLLRLFADFENFKKRVARERMEYVKTAGEDIFQAILPVLDDLDRAEKSIESAVDVEAVKEGLDLITKKLRSALMNKGLKEIEVIGEVFDSEIHDAIAQIPAPSEDMKGKVIDCAEKGYSLNGVVIRNPKVVVGQ